MSKSPVMTPARLAANRLNALKSTGPKTYRGKTMMRMNGLKTGGRSRFFVNFLVTMSQAPPYFVDQTAAAILTQARHPLFVEGRRAIRQAEIATSWHFRSSCEQRKARN
jgi:hypothetical protein